MRAGKFAGGKTIGEDWTSKTFDIDQRNIQAKQWAYVVEHLYDTEPLARQHINDLLVSLTEQMRKKFLSQYNLTTRADMDRDDYENGMIAELLEKFPKNYKPGASSPSSYAYTIMQGWLMEHTCGSIPRKINKTLFGKKGTVESMNGLFSDFKDSTERENSKTAYKMPDSLVDTSMDSVAEQVDSFSWIPKEYHQFIEQATKNINSLPREARERIRALSIIYDAQEHNSKYFHGIYCEAKDMDILDPAAMEEPIESVPATRLNQIYNAWLERRLSQARTVYNDYSTPECIALLRRILIDYFELSADKFMDFWNIATINSNGLKTLANAVMSESPALTLQGRREWIASLIFPKQYKFDLNAHIIACLTSNDTHINNTLSAMLPEKREKYLFYYLDWYMSEILKLPNLRARFEFLCQSSNASTDGTTMSELDVLTKYMPCVKYLTDSYENLADFYYLHLDRATRQKAYLLFAMCRMKGDDYGALEFQNATHLDKFVAMHKAGASLNL